VFLPQIIGPAFRCSAPLLTRSSAGPTIPCHATAIGVPAPRNISTPTNPTRWSATPPPNQCTPRLPRAHSWMSPLPRLRYDVMDWPVSHFWSTDKPQEDNNGHPNPLLFIDTAPTTIQRSPSCSAGLPLVTRAVPVRTPCRSSYPWTP
jgi:hypothetical protein